MKILIKTHPNASKNEVKKLNGVHYRVYVTKSPHAGKANMDVITLLARYFDVSPSRVHIVAGHLSREKTVEVQGVVS